MASVLKKLQKATFTFTFYYKQVSNLLHVPAAFLQWKNGSSRWIGTYVDPTDGRGVLEKRDISVPPQKYEFLRLQPVDQSLPCLRYSGSTKFCKEDKLIQKLTAIKTDLIFFWPCIIVSTCINYQFNAWFLYSITICMLHYILRHVRSINMSIFRRTNFTITASGIVALYKRLYSTPVESRL